MPPRHARLNIYGHPLPELTEARQEVLKDSPSNQACRRFVYALLEEQLAALLRRGIHADVTVVLKIVDGVILEPIRVGTTRHWRVPSED